MRAVIGVPRIAAVFDARRPSHLLVFVGGRVSLTHRRSETGTGGRIGGPEGIRTPDLFNAIEARSQLRHRPTFRTDAIDECPIFTPFRMTVKPNAERNDMRFSCPDCSQGDFRALVDWRRKSRENRDEASPVANSADSDFFRYFLFAGVD
jgi:hypothetical protein